MKRKSLTNWIKENRKEIDRIIRNECPNIGASISDKERRLWISNHYGLYNWARSENINV